MGYGPYKVLIDEIMEDGVPYLILGYHGCGVVTVEQGDGAGNSNRIAINPFSNQQALGDRHVHNLAVGDVNGDGKKDLAIALGGLSASDPGQIIVAQNMGNGGFTERWRADLPSQVKGVALADINNDGVIDLVAVSRGEQASGWANGKLHLWKGHGNFIFDAHKEVVIGASAYDVELADFNNDGYLDFAVPNERGNGEYVHYILNPGASIFDTNTALTPIALSMTEIPGQPAHAVNAVRAGKFTGSGHTDLVAASTNGFLGLWRGNGDGTFKAARILSAKPGATDIAVGDLEGSGKNSIVVTHYLNTPYSSVFIGRGGDIELLPQSNYAAGLGNYGVAIGNFVRSQKQAVLIANYVSHSITILFNNGDGTFYSIQRGRGINFVNGQWVSE